MAHLYLINTYFNEQHLGVLVTTHPNTRTSFCGAVFCNSPLTLKPSNV